MTGASPGSAVLGVQAQESGLDLMCANATNPAPLLDLMCPYTLSHYFIIPYPCPPPALILPGEFLSGPSGILVGPSTGRMEQAFPTGIAFIEHFMTFL